MMASDDDERDEPRNGSHRRARRDVLDIGESRISGRRQEGSDRRQDDRDRSREADGDEDTSLDKKDSPKDGQGKPDNKKADDKGKDDKAGKSGKADDQKSDEKDQAKRKSRRPLIITIAVVVALLLIAAGVYYYITHRDKVDTDDAYTDGRVVSISPRISGQVVSLDVNDNQFVHKGDPLIHIDPRQFDNDKEQAKGSVDASDAQVVNQRLGVEIAKKNFPASLQLAQANLASAKADLLLRESNYNRQKSLPKQATTQQDVDQATSAYQQAQAAVAQAEARVVQSEPVQQNIGQSQAQLGELGGQAEQSKSRLDQANLNLEWTVVRAPQDGYVTRRNVEEGNYVSAGTQIMSLVTPDVWVTANFKETQLDGMRPGQRVTIEVDAYPDLALHGHVDSIQRGSGSKFSAFPAATATGNFIKIVQRVPVKIVIDSGLDPNVAMPLGVSVVPTVTLR